MRITNLLSSWQQQSTTTSTAAASTLPTSIIIRENKCKEMQFQSTIALPRSWLLIYSRNLSQPTPSIAFESCFWLEKTWKTCSENYFFWKQKFQRIFSLPNRPCPASHFAVFLGPNFISFERIFDFFAVCPFSRGWVKFRRVKLAKSSNGFIWISITFKLTRVCVIFIAFDSYYPVQRTGTELESQHNLKVITDLWNLEVQRRISCSNCPDYNTTQLS